MDIVVYVASGIILLAFIISLVIRHERKRREALRLTAQTLGYGYTRKMELEGIGKAEMFHLFNIGHSKQIRNFMKREESGFRQLIYEYQYTTGGGQNSHTAIQTVFQFESERLKLPAFIIRPENIFHKIGQSFGYKDIDFDAYPEFSKKTLLRGEDETTIRKLFNQEIVEIFKIGKGLVVEGKDQMMICYRSAKRIKPDRLRVEAEQMQNLYHTFIRRCEYI